MTLHMARKFNNNMTFCQLRYFTKHLISRCTHSYAISQQNLNWPATKIRRTFIEYFKDRHKHLYVPSSSVLPNKGDGVYFTNAGMNQFKPLLLGTVDPNTAMYNYKRVINSQKCIRVGGKHNDLDDVGRDLYHHTFFEMLGNWSFGDYFKKEACEMALDLITNVYHIPVDCLYVTYFAGDENLRLDADEETRKIWLALGFPESRVLPFGSRDNFWEMGPTGPCGPCTEIHYDHGGDRCASSLVNTGSHDVIELWNLVFMQYHRQMDGSLLPLQKHHIDTGLGLERLTAVLQNTGSNYDTDLFTPIFDHINQNCDSPKYGGQIDSNDKKGIDTAYRIVADHSRMLSVCIADGLMPAKHNLGHRLRDIIHRCIKNSNSVLGTPPGFISSLVDVVVQSLGEAFPELRHQQSRIKSVVTTAEKHYTKSIERQQKDYSKVLHTVGDISLITDKQAHWLMEKCADIVPDLHELCDVISSRGLTRRVDEQVSLNQLNTGPLLSPTSLDLLSQRGCVSTDDSHKYNYHKIDGSQDYVMERLTSQVYLITSEGEPIDQASPDAQKLYGIVTQDTNFYTEGGGQAADIGRITTHTGEFEVTDVQRYHGYIVHIGHMKQGHISINDTATMLPDMASRTNCARNHSATHLLNHSLSRLLDPDVRQNGSAISGDKFTFDFTSTESDNIKNHLKTIENSVRSMIQNNLDVHHTTLVRESAMDIANLRYLHNETYPDTVRVVAIGTPVDDLLSTDLDPVTSSVELCGGTHVLNTGDIGEFCITKCTGIAQGTVRITAVTHDKATCAWENERKASKLLTKLRTELKARTHWEDCADLAKDIDKTLSQSLFPRSSHTDMKADLIKLKNKISRRRDGEHVRLMVEDMRRKLVDSTSSQPFHCWTLHFTSLPQAVVAMGKATLARPTCGISSFNHTTNAVIYLPQSFTNTGPLSIISKIADLPDSQHGLVPGQEHFYFITLKGAYRQDQLRQSVESVLGELL